LLILAAKSRRSLEVQVPVLATRSPTVENVTVSPEGSCCYVSWSQIKICCSRCCRWQYRLAVFWDQEFWNFFVRLLCVGGGSSSVSLLIFHSIVLGVLAVDSFCCVAESAWRLLPINKWDEWYVYFFVNSI
jgi:hypothetical protein